VAVLQAVHSSALPFGERAAPAFDFQLQLQLLGLSPGLSLTFYCLNRAAYGRYAAVARSFYGRALMRYERGVAPVQRLNALRKFDRSENPTRWAISSTGKRVDDRN
jgi:hypothetical protein